VTLKDPGAWGHGHWHDALQISLARTVPAAQRGMRAMGERGEVGGGEGGGGLKELNDASLAQGIEFRDTETEAAIETLLNSGRPI
jgi:hypothetical protein